MSETLKQHLAFVRQASAGESQQIIDERIRFAEILWYHAESGWLDKTLITRALNLICNPETWDEWKRAGGDSGVK